MNAKVNFAESSQPALEPSKYTVTVSQKANIAGCEISGGTLDFAVETDPALMNNSLVYSVYPPKCASGKYQGCLPHIVLHRHTLPWERRLFQADKNLPWLALLVFSQDENVFAKQDTFGSATDETDGVYIPVFRREYWPCGDVCSFIDIPRELFEKVLPTKTDLSYIAHTREVSLLDKVTDPDVLDGLFSCIIANRYPRAPEAGGAPVRHEAHLVSLEGFADYINDREKHNIGICEAVRMFSLFSWEFLCSELDFDFMSAAGKMEAGALCPGMDKAFEEITLNKLTELGYCPVNHVMREGSIGVAWYRPPLLPREPWDEEISFHHYADSLLKYDSQSGMMDVTYQAAWQLGRLLAIRDRRFASKLIAWRLDNKLNAAKRQVSQIVAKKINADRRGMNSADDTMKDMFKEMVIELLKRCGQGDSLGLRGANIPRFKGGGYTADSFSKLTQGYLLEMFRVEPDDND